MDNQKFIEKCKQIVSGYINRPVNGMNVTVDDICVVWLSKTLQNNKALLSTNLSDGMYYELTYNGDKKELYFDTYKKQGNIKYNL